MTPEQLTRATFLYKRLELQRKEVRDWGVRFKAIAVQVMPPDEMWLDLRPVVLTGERVDRVLKEVIGHIKLAIEETEAELTALGIEFEPMQMTVGDVSIGRSLQ